MGRITKVEEEQTKRRIEMLASEDMSTSEIAETLGVSAATVYRYRDRFGIQIREGSRGRKPENKENGQDLKDKVEYLAKAGATIADIAAKLKIPPSIVKSIADKHGIAVQGSY